MRALIVSSIARFAGAHSNAFAAEVSDGAIRVSRIFSNSTVIGALKQKDAVMK
jgi:hypothetical protein